MIVRIYIEGGGDQRASHVKLRQGFSDFFRKVLLGRPQPKPIPGGSREGTFDSFKTALVQHRADMILLLVDSEGPVATGARPWAHLKKQDGWDQPAGSTDDQAHLMVQCMEAWFLADKEALAEYYAQGFRQNALPSRANVEEIPKKNVFTVLENATRDTKKGPYDKTEHGFAILARVDPNRVRTASKHAEALLEVLLRVTSS